MHKSINPMTLDSLYEQRWEYTIYFNTRLCSFCWWKWSRREVAGARESVGLKRGTWMDNKKSEGINGMEICGGFITWTPNSLTHLPLGGDMCNLSLESGWACDGFDHRYDRSDVIWLPRLDQKDHAPPGWPSCDTHSGGSQPSCRKPDYPETTMLERPGVGAARQPQWISQSTVSTANLVSEPFWIPSTADLWLQPNHRSNPRQELSVEVLPECMAPKL